MTRTSSSSSHEAIAALVATISRRQSMREDLKLQRVTQRTISNAPGRHEAKLATARARSPSASSRRFCSQKQVIVSPSERSQTILWLRLSLRVCSTAAALREPRRRPFGTSSSSSTALQWTVSTIASGLRPPRSNPRLSSVGHLADTIRSDVARSRSPAHSARRRRRS